MEAWYLHMQQELRGTPKAAASHFHMKYMGWMLGGLPPGEALCQRGLLYIHARCYLQVQLVGDVPLSQESVWQATQLQDELHNGLRTAEAGTMLDQLGCMQAAVLGVGSLHQRPGDKHEGLDCHHQRDDEPMQHVVLG